MNLVPTNSDTTAVTIKSWIAALKTPDISGIWVLSEMLFIIWFISLLDSVMFVVWIVPARLTRTFFPSPGTSMLNIDGSIKKGATFPS